MAPQTLIYSDIGYEDEESSIQSPADTQVMVGSSARAFLTLALFRWLFEWLCKWFTHVVSLCCQVFDAVGSVIAKLGKESLHGHDPVTDSLSRPSSKHKKLVGKRARFHMF